MAKTERPYEHEPKDFRSESFGAMTVHIGTNDRPTSSSTVDIEPNESRVLKSLNQESSRPST